MHFCGNFSTTIAMKWKNCGIPSPVGKNKILLNPFDGSFLVHYGDISCVLIPYLRLRCPLQQITEIPIFTFFYRGSTWT